jgi:hypothetical protein
MGFTFLYLYDTNVHMHLNLGLILLRLAWSYRYTDFACPTAFDSCAKPPAARQSLAFLEKVL